MILSKLLNCQCSIIDNSKKPGLFRTLKKFHKSLRKLKSLQSHLNSTGIDKNELEDIIVNPRVNCFRKRYRFDLSDAEKRREGNRREEESYFSSK